MVNTFITDSSYVQCAKNLNSQRLGKQRVEAYQILIILQDYNYISAKLNIPLPSTHREDYICLANQNYKGVADNFEKRCLWMQDVAKKYSLMSHVYIQERRPLGPDTVPKFFKISKENLKTASPQKIKEFKLKYRFVLYAKGYIHHPIVKMWCGYEISLKHYITCCIDEWIFRGYKNTMTRYPLGLNPLGLNPSLGVTGVNPPLLADLLSHLVKPWWTDSHHIHNSHKISLLMKEKERNEKPWYWLKKDFVDLVSGQKDFVNEYIWISQLSQNDKIDLLESIYKKLHVTSRFLKNVTS